MSARFAPLKRLVCPRSRPAATVALAICFAVAAGCSLTEKPVWNAPRLAAFYLSPYSAGNLQSLGADREREVRWRLDGAGDPGLAFSLAEWSYVSARQSELNGCADCVDQYYAAAVHAWRSLFSPGELPCGEACRARAGELYNSAVAKFVDAARRFGRFTAPAAVRVNAPGPMTVPIEYLGFPWKPEEFCSLNLVGDFQSSELGQSYCRRGLGAPFVAVRCRGPRVEADGQFLPGHQPLAVTAVLRPPEAPGDGGACRLVLYDPLRVDCIQAGGRSRPLAADFSAPLAVALMDPHRTTVEFGGFLSPEGTRQYTGLTMLEPYQPGKVPVVFVHGLASGPLTWSAMINHLRADPAVRNSFQFWVFRYPSGGPFLQSAARLRCELNSALRLLDPEGRDPALRGMVLVGHSMGGLMCKLQAAESGCTLWNQVSRRPLASLNVSQPNRARLARWFFFQPQPFVRRVIYVATPHRGTSLRNRLAARTGALFVSQPGVEQFARRVTSNNPGVFAAGLTRTSVDLVSPQDALSIGIRRLPVSHCTTFHSLIGTGGSSLGGGPTDGVVSLASARAPHPTASQFVFSADHRQVHRHRRSADEVRRILMEHLASGRLCN